MARKTKRGGGRKPGVWTLVTAEAIKKYREEHKVSRVRLAQMVGVSSTSVQNWESGVPPMPKTQQRLAEVIAAGAAGVQPLRRLPSMFDPASTAGDALKTTGTIVAAYAQAAKRLTPEDLVGLIKSVRAALA